jgi:hypothetical protein
MGQVVDIDGNARPDIRYISHADGMSIYLADNRISYLFTELVGDLEHHRHADGFYDAEHPEPIVQIYRIDLELIGASAAPEITGDLPGAGYTNYYLPHLPNGLMHVPTFGRVSYRNIYPNIDFVVYRTGDDRQSAMKYDFVVRPGGRVSDIRMRYVGEIGQEIDRDGGLVTTTPLGTLSDKAPYSFQEPASASAPTQTAERRSVASRYRLVDGVISFIVDDYDTQRTLVIDPTQLWSTYYGGTGAEDLNGGDATEMDRSGNVLFAGSTDNSTFPTSPGAYSATVSGSTDIVVVKMSSTGTRLWATIYGGTAQELAHAIVSDNDRNIFIAGHTFSSNFPVSTGAHQTTFGGGTGNRDAFTVKFDSNGVRQWATYYGGNQFDDSYGFAIDGNGNPAMAGTTASTTGIATSGTFQTGYNSGTSTSKYDGFLVKFNSLGVRQWGTYVGGSETEYCYGAAADSRGNINITGWTNSTNFPVTSGTFQTSRSGGYDAFVIRFNSAGARLWGTYFGGSGNENDEPGGGIGFAAITIDGDGNPLITGMTTGNLPTSAGAIQSTFGGGINDAFVAKFDTLGGRLWSTYYGGSGNDIGQGIASTTGNGVVITGHTFSANFPGITADALQQTHAGTGTTSDAFIVMLDRSGTARRYVTYYGGAGNDEGVGVSSNRLGSIVVGGTAADSFPVTNGAFQTRFGGGTTDAFLTFFCDFGTGTISSSGPTSFCSGDSVMLSVAAGYSSYLWQSLTNRSISSERTITVRESGDYWVRLTNGAGCLGYTDTIRVQEFPGAATPTITAAGTILTSTPASSYQWSREGVWIPGATGRSYTAPVVGVYTVTITDSNGCRATSEPWSLTSSIGSDMADRSGASALKPIQPNPTSGITSIEYQVATAGRTRILLVDMLGQTTPIVDRSLQPGHHSATFDASTLPVGRYFCILEAGSERVVQIVTISR